MQRTASPQRLRGRALGALVAMLLAGCGAPAVSTTAIGAVTARQAVASPSAQRLLVRTTAPGRSAFAARQIGATPLGEIPQLGLATLGLPGGTRAADAMARLASMPGVTWAEPDHRLSLRTSVADPGRAAQWGLDAMRVPAAWTRTRGDARVVVAVLDTGVDLGHPDLRTRLVEGRSFVSGRSGPGDDNGHGTHVAGTIVAEADNGVGVAGVAPGCRVMPVKVLDAEGAGHTADIVAGLVWAADHGARIINLSLGGAAGGQALGEAIRYAQAKGCLVVAAMGNEGAQSQEYPAAMPGVLAVGSTDEAGRRSSFSNFGSWISVAAPGSGILSTTPTYDVTMSRQEGLGRGYGSLSGTSMATPHAAGLAALLASLHPDWPAQVLHKQLLASTRDIGTPGFDIETGHGMLDAWKAVNLR
ncbi:MAG: S8 family peptidase [Candidatus Sericytochromatia bacterium]|nr:S8 family peptidase [Candidatus Sericytochromatia bacterium]